MYANGKGVLQDNVYAHMWFNIAASNGHEIAAISRDIMVNEMTPSDISKAQQLARECVAKDYKGCWCESLASFCIMFTSHKGNLSRSYDSDGF